MTLILTVCIGDEEKTVTAEDIAVYHSTPKTEKGQAFLETCRAIEALLEGTDEWKALPDYENFYE